MKINITRGDDVPFKFKIVNLEGEPVQDIDDVTFTVKKDKYSSPIFHKKYTEGTIRYDNETHYYTFEINAIDTTALDFGKYVYDIERIIHDKRKTLAVDELILNTEVTTLFEENLLPENENLLLSLDEAQEILTLEDNVLVIHDGGGSGDTFWGDIRGVLSQQTDLKNVLDSKLEQGDIPTNISVFNNDAGYITAAHHDDTKQNVIDNEHKLDYSLLNNTPDIPDISGKVDKVDGKGLSTEDYTTEEKNKLSGLSNYDDTQIVNGLNNKVDKIVNKGLSSNDYTDNEKTKLAGLFNYDDTSISNRVLTIEGKIPSQATSENQLADKSFVNSSIATATATFRGTFNSLADLQAYSGEHDENDYAFVIDTDNSGNTLYKRYKFTNNQWLFEYTLNNSSFTAEQWAAINSGITANDKSTYDGYATSKQDKIDSTHKLDYSLIDNQPTIPSKTSDLNNDSGFITDSYHDNSKQNLVTEDNKIPYAYISGTPTIPTVPTQLSELSDDATHRLVTDTEKSAWDGKQSAISNDNKLPYAYLSGTPTIPTVPNNIVVGSSQSYTIWVGTESDYNSIGTKDSNTLYFIK